MGRAYEVRKASIEATGKQKGKLYTTYAKEIYLVAKKGGCDIDGNISLKRLIDKAKKEQVPSDIINRALDKAKGLGQDEYHEVIYEGFGPGASTFVIKCLTDNVNRTVGMVRAAFNKVNKSLGVNNSVLYNYDNLGVIRFKTNKEEQIFNELLENNIEPIEFEKENDILTISVSHIYFNDMKDIVEKIEENVEYIYDEVGLFAKDEITLNEEDKEIYNKLYNLLDDIDDVSKIYTNVKE